VPVVLFLCVHNAGRSQMAMGFFRHRAGDRAVAMPRGEAVRPVRDEIERRVRWLLDDLGVGG
jgi:protein-tyrosine-phosphatase